MRGSAKKKKGKAAAGTAGRSLLVGAALLLLAPFPAWALENLTAREILDRVDDLFRGQSSRGRMSMTIRTEHWDRSLTLDFWSEGKDRSLFRILAPVKEKGTATLRVGNDMWNYLPKVNRVIKLPSSMMSASWMGSHFTNDDLVKESRMADDFDFEITREGIEEGRAIIHIACRPKPEAAVVWGKVVAVVERDTWLPRKLLYYDEDLRLARTMSFAEVGSLGDRTLPRRVWVVPEDKPDEKTEVFYENIVFDVPLPEDTFSLRTLQR